MANPTDISHPLFARMWTLFLSPGAEHAGVAEHRDELLAGLSGRVVEIGAPATVSTSATTPRRSPRSSLSSPSRTCAVARSRRRPRCL